MGKQNFIRIALGFLPFTALLWWFAVSKLVVWWWVELMLARASMSEIEAFITFSAVAGMCIGVIPHFYWLPVYCFKELRAWSKLG